MTATANRKATSAERKPAPSKVTFRAAASSAAKPVAEPSKPAGAVRPRKSATQPELVSVSADQYARPTHHRGVAILKEERMATPLGGYFRITRLLLADDTVAFACWDCVFTAERRGGVMTHRNEEHGSRFIMDKKTRLRRLAAKDPEAYDFIMPDREDGSRPGDLSRDWTIGEIQAVMPSIRALGDHLEAQDALIAELTERLKETRVSKSDQHKIDVYRSNQEEIIELRGQIARMGNYEELKQEVYTLRKFKKGITRKLSSLGAQLSEDED